MKQLFQDILKTALFLLPLLVANALIVLNTVSNESLVYFALTCFAWAVIYPYISTCLDGKLVDFIYYSLAIAGIVLFAQSQLNEKALVGAEFELVEATKKLELLDKANDKFEQLITSSSSVQFEQYIDEWIESPFVSIDSMGILEMEYWLEQENVQQLTKDSKASIAAMTERLNKLIADAERERETAKDALINAKATQSTEKKSNALLSKVIQLNVWPYLMCLAFALKIARKRII